MISLHSRPLNRDQPNRTFAFTRTCSGFPSHLCRISPPCRRTPMSSHRRPITKLHLFASRRISSLEDTRWRTDCCTCPRRNHAPISTFFKEGGKKKKGTDSPAPRTRVSSLSLSIETLTRGEKKRKEKRRKSTER